MIKVADALLDDGKHDVADFLMDFASGLAESLGLSSNLTILVKHFQKNLWGLFLI